MKDIRVYLTHALECIARIERYTVGGEPTFVGSEMVQDAVVRNLQTLGQSLAQLPLNLKDAHAEIDWRSITGFRNVLVHGYLGVNLSRVWEIVQNDVPVLKRALETMRKELDRQP